MSIRKRYPHEAVQLPEDVYELIRVGKNEFPDMFWGFNYDEWPTIEQFKKAMQEQLRKAREKRDKI